MPTGPGCSQVSPSSVIPCTAIAISPASAACSCSAISLLGEPGPLERPAGHREADADGERDQRERDEAGRARRPATSRSPSGRGSCRHPSRRTRCGRRTTARALEAILSPRRSWTRIPPHAASTRRAPRGPDRSAAFASASASSAVGARAVAAIRPVQAGCAGRRGRAGGGRRSRRSVCHTRRSRPDVATAPSVTRSVSRGAAHARRRGCRRAARHRRSRPRSDRRREPRRGPVGGEALGAAAEVEPQAGRAGDRAAAWSTCDLAPAAAGRRRAARRERRAGRLERARARRRRACGRVARVLERVEQRRVGEPAGPPRAEQRGGDGVAQQRRGGHDAARVGVQRAQLARCVEARQPRGERLDPVAHRVERRVGGASRRTVVPMEGKLQLVHDDPVATGAERARPGRARAPREPAPGPRRTGRARLLRSGRRVERGAALGHDDAPQHDAVHDHPPLRDLRGGLRRPERRVAARPHLHREEREQQRRTRRATTASAPRARACARRRAAPRRGRRCAARPEAASVVVAATAAALARGRWPPSSSSRRGRRSRRRLAAAVMAASSSPPRHGRVVGSSAAAAAAVVVEAVVVAPAPAARGGPGWRHGGDGGRPARSGSGSGSGTRSATRSARARRRSTRTPARGGARSRGRSRSAPRGPTGRRRGAAVELVGGCVARGEGDGGEGAEGDHGHPGGDLMA